MDQKRFYQEISGEIVGDKLIPNAEESRKFWSDIWGKEETHNENAEWLKKLKETGGYPQQEDTIITEDDVRQMSKKMSNWKAAGPDGVQGFWIKKLTNCHKRISEQFGVLVNGQEDIPEWLTTGRTVLCLKDRSKGNAVDNYRPISCLPLMWKLLTGILADSMYNFLEQNNIFPVEQKGCKRDSRGTKDQLIIDKTVLKDCKRRKTNLGMAWIDYRKAYDMIPHSWIIECLKLFGVAQNIENFLSRSMKGWATELTSNGHSLGSIDIKRGIFQGDSLSPLLFVLCMVPLSLILREAKAGYEFKGKEQKINHLLFMDDLKLYGKDENQVTSLINTVHCFSTDIKMEFGLKKCGVLILRRGKIEQIEGIPLPNADVMKQIDKEGYKYLGILEIDDMMEESMKTSFKQEYFRRLRLVLKSKLNGRNKFTAINTWAIALLRYGAGVIRWRKDELQVLDRKTRKLLTLYGAFHPKSDTDRLYMPRRKGGRGLISCQDCITSEENNLAWYIKHSTEPLLVQVKLSGLLNSDNCVDKITEKRTRIDNKETRWKEKKMYGQFVREIPVNTDQEKRWLWLQKSDLKPETEALICAAQEQAIRTNYVKNRIDHTSDDDKCRMCGEKGETVWHIVSECAKLAQKEYKRRHDNVARIIHWELCNKFGLEKARYWYEHKPEGVIENDQVKILWDFMIQCDHMIEHRKPDIVVVNKEDKSCMVIDIACPGDIRVAEKENEKVQRYDDLKREIKKLWSMKTVQVVPVVIGALGTVSNKIEMWIKTIGVNVKVGHMQKTTLLGTARILRKVLEN